MADKGASTRRAEIRSGITKAGDATVSNTPIGSSGEYVRDTILARDTHFTGTSTTRRGAGLTGSPLGPYVPDTRHYYGTFRLKKGTFSTFISAVVNFDDRPTKVRTTVSRNAFGGSSSGSAPISPITTFFKMRGIDPDCGSLTYRVWIVTGSPDTTGAQYSGTRCGGSPLTNIVIDAIWQV